MSGSKKNTNKLFIAIYLFAFDKIFIHWPPKITTTTTNVACHWKHCLSLLLLRSTYFCLLFFLITSERNCRDNETKKWSSTWENWIRLSYTAVIEYFLSFFGADYSFIGHCNIIDINITWRFGSLQQWRELRTTTIICYEIDMEFVVWIL